ncbi:butyrate kinase [Candidatus Micrarchaeota archaeon CG_4_10_14_0_2_um_filter_55_9]|nr:MAG: hypothetical protein AUJ15_00745 [Candidatus Micrarchaeota archaeon CG1_02_55_41]PIO03543.1 MAG: butyrate kinase [Candidatus Micrarchaeota archaeon CG09_land_8_20_14_0_10_55_25]PIZ91447.1 MAG: butyrate kinase [Candidatus Micrarchaeota archaeon CG_4_10_14_0_2_um_filter_55_9]PJD01585.1 MAG: butyrate kinase [Candidatus Micrarchaeota archaeon CG10_big_fil_rev_8_21_14_0_10_54_18]
MEKAGKPRILVINPGSTSTKLAIFEGEKEVAGRELRHPPEELEEFAGISEQADFRTAAVLDFLKKIGSLDYIVARGGLLGRIKGGTYKINEEMLDTLKKQPFGEHACNLGALIAKEIQDGGKYGKPEILVVDPPSVFETVPPKTGHPKIDEYAQKRFHALNHKAVLRLAAKELGFPLEESSVIVAHLGGGATIALHENNRAVRVTDGLDEGPMTPQRSGTVPSGATLLFNEDNLSSAIDEHPKKRMSKKEAKALCTKGRKKTLGDLVGGGGFRAYLGTTDFDKIEEMLKDKKHPKHGKAKEIVDAFIDSVAEHIGAFAMHAPKLDAILITGGLANSKLIEKELRRKLQKSYLGGVTVKFYPRTFEMGALRDGALRLYNGEEKAKNYKRPAK